MPTLQVTQTKNQFKLDEPVLYEFREMKVESIDDGYVTSVRDDYFSIGCGRHGNVFPVTSRGLEIASFFKLHDNHLRRLDGIGAGILNWPDIANYLKHRFDFAMLALMRGSEGGVNQELTATNVFISLTTDYHDRARNSFVVHGVHVIGRR